MSAWLLGSALGALVWAVGLVPAYDAHRWAHRHDRPSWGLQRRAWWAAVRWPSRAVRWGWGVLRVRLGWGDQRKEGV